MGKLFLRKVKFYLRNVNSVFSFLPFRRTRVGSRREPSLSKALASSQDRLILLEGEPGSGKSVALRHVAEAMAKKAKSSYNLGSVIPIYVNLKEFDRPNGVDVNRNLIESFVLKTLKSMSDSNIDQYIDDEFQKGIRNGTWFFIFDSFDEIPDVLSSTEADQAVKTYGDAIDDFLHGSNHCRGIIASRKFHGPEYLKKLEWSKFSILSLSEKYRHQPIQHSGLPSKLAKELLGQLGEGNPTIRSMASNSLFLALLCEHMKSGKPFPPNVHTVFETYIENRLTRDDTRLHRRFGVDTTLIRATAETIAFCMTADTRLSPTRGDLEAALIRQQMVIPNNFHALLDALEFIKIAHRDDTPTTGPTRKFTFAHRRIQEYFATCVVLREPARVSPAELLTKPLWRETAVVLCQTQPVDKLTFLLEQAERILAPSIDTIPTGPLNLESVSPLQPQIPSSFPWPSNGRHVLALLQDGLTDHLSDVPDHIRHLVANLLVSATRRGILLDKKWALEVAGIVPQPVLENMLKEAFASESQWLREVAYRQASRLDSTPPEVAQDIYNALIELVASNRLRREQDVVRTHLARLQQSANFL